MMDILVYFIATAVLVGVTVAVEQEDVKGANITLACSLPGTVTFPTWKGPPDSTVYLTEGQETNSNYSWVSYADNNRDLVVSDALPNYSGDYTCEKDGNAAETITLSVLAKPEVMIANTEDVTDGNFLHSNVLRADEDKNLTITCTATGANPAPNLVIMVNNSNIEDIDYADQRSDPNVTESSSVFTVVLSRTIPAKRDYDLMEVRCTATNPAPTNKLGNYSEEASTTIYLRLKPLVFTFQSGGQVDVGEDSTAICTAMIGRPAPTITWLYDGQPIDTARMVITNRTRTPVQADETVTVSETLTIKKMRREDNKKGLQCLVEHELLDSPREIGTASMLVNFGPDFVNITGNKKVFASPGATLTLTCTSASVGPSASNNTIKWRNETSPKFNKRLNSDREVTYAPGDNNGQTASQSLTLEVTKYMDRHEITCYSLLQVNWLKEVTTTVTLDIDYPPIIIDPEDAITRFAEHDNAALLCSAWSKPPSNFTWYKDGDNTPLATGTGTLERNAFSLLLNDIGYNNSGKYKCIATNKDGFTDEKEVEVIITESPELPIDFNLRNSDYESISVTFSPPEEKPRIPQSYFLQYRNAEDTAGLWHQVVMPTDSQNSDANILKDLKYNTLYEVRIKVVNKYGSERYTAAHSIRTRDLPEDQYTRKDLDIAIAVSVVVTAVVITALAVIIFCCWKKRMCGSSSEKFELQTR